jgi:hypothetical protein
VRVTASATCTANTANTVENAHIKCRQRQCQSVKYPNPKLVEW